MSEEKDYEIDPEVEAMNYGTIWTNALFEPGQPALKFARHGVVNIRIPWAAIIWGAIVAIPFGVIAWLIAGKILNLGYIGSPIIIFFAGLGAVLGAKLGMWSPMQKSTGEDLVTYAMIALRQRLSSGGGKVSRTTLNSMAIGGEDGRLISCTQWIGTQPLRNAPPMSPYEQEDGEVYKTEYRIIPRGELKVVSSEGYNDGLGDRF